MFSLILLSLLCNRFCLSTNLSWWCYAPLNKYLRGGVRQRSPRSRSKLRRRCLKVIETCLCRDCDRDCVCNTWERRHSSKDVCAPKQLGTMTQSDEDGDKQCFLGARGLKVSDRKIKDFSSSKFTLLVCLTQDSPGRSLLLSVRTQLAEKKKSFFQVEWAVSTSVCACICDSVCLCVWLLYWRCSCIFDNNDVEPSQIDRKEKEKIWTRMRAGRRKSDSAGEKNYVTH